MGRRERQRDWYQKNREEILARKRARYRADPEKYRERKRRQYQADPEKARASYKVRARVNRLAALNAYGGLQCVCCGELEERFLTIDHINGCSKEQRKLEGQGSQLYQFLKTRNYPPGYQVLCFNCNMGREKNGGICPHQDPERLFVGRIKRFDSDSLPFGWLPMELEPPDLYS